MKTCSTCRRSMRNWAHVVRRMMRGEQFGGLTRSVAIRTAAHFRDGDCHWHQLDQKGGAR
jgi:hypothetical protein